jgi:segregation and condensation protein A
MTRPDLPSGYRPANPFNTRHPQYGSGYPVQLPIFEGPLDLLLHLIEREELDINEVSLVAVTDQYLRTIEQWEEVVPGALADFLVVASRLLYIKSNRLLPRPPAGDEEDEDGPDSLIRHLLEYRQFKRVAESLREREDAGWRAFARSVSPPDTNAFGSRPPDLSAVDLPLLQKALQRALARMPDEPPTPKVQPYTVTVAEKIDEVRALFGQVTGEVGDRGAGAESRPKTGRRLSFSEVAATSRTRLEVIVTFLAVLELMKQQRLEAVQEKTFGEIYLVWDESDAVESKDEDNEDEDETD